MKKKLNKIEKTSILILIPFFVLLLLFLKPSFARFINRSVPFNNLWSGEVASSYHSGNGSSAHPYLISNGEELAYFASQLEENDYENVYFKLGNDIRLNEGIFRYENSKKEYILGEDTYYLLDEDFYDNDDYIGDASGSILLFPSLDGFKGHFDGDYHIIYGFYSIDDENGLFTNLSGEITSLYLSNCMVEGNNSGILSNQVTNGTIRNVMVDGILISDSYQGNGLVDDLTVIKEETYTVSGGIAAYATDSTFQNCINKVEIYGSFLSGGLIGSMEDTTVQNAYSTSNLDSHSSNAIGLVLGTSIVDKIYQTGTINGGLIGYLVDADLTISNSFIPIDNDFLVGEDNSTISSTDNYYTYAGRGDHLSSTLATTSDLKDPLFLTSYGSFVDFTAIETNPLNAWVFEEDYYPTLFIDDIINPYVELTVGNYMWNSFSTFLDTKRFTDPFTFMISSIDNVHTYQRYYYISNSRTPLSKSDLENVVWTNYEGFVRMSDEGVYVIYVKVVQGNDVSYMNSDILVLDQSLPNIDIQVGEDHYSSIQNTTITMTQAFSATVSAEDTLSGVKSIEYYIADDFINDYDVEWIPYQSTISFNQTGDYVLYVKVVDGCDYVTYASTPLMIFDGYTSSVNPLGSNTGNTITSNSSMVYHFTCGSHQQYNLTHYLISSVVLPRNTVITLNDKVNHKVYGYTITTNDDYGYETNQYATYPFTLFVEKGKNNGGNGNYVEGNVTNEQFEIIFDFSRTTISNNLSNISLRLEGRSNNEVVRDTLSTNTYNIHTGNNTRLSHTISTSYQNSILYHSDAVYEIPINSVVSYSSALDTSYFDKKIGLSIKLVDSSGRIISRDYLKNFTFYIGNNQYLPAYDSIIRINLGTNASTNTTLVVTTHQCSSDLRDGTYYLKINPYSSFNGLYSDGVLENNIMIPVVVSHRTNSSLYGFDVSIDSDSRIIEKDGDVPLSFTITQSGLDNPNIKVSMYEKDEVTAYNQDYTLINMGLYTDVSLERYMDSIYYVSRNPQEETTLSFNLDTSLLPRTSYKFVFDLYNGDILVGSISKNIILR